MRVMEPAIDWDEVAKVNRACEILGVQQLPVREWVDEHDFDPDSVKTELEKVIGAAEAIATAGVAFELTADPEVWEGEAAEAMTANAECQRGFWDHVLDFLLWLAENIVQLIDYIVDVLRIIVAWITWIVTAVGVIAAIVIIIGSAIAGMGVGAIFGALVDSAILAVTGAIAVLGIIASLLLSGLNWLLEQLQELIRSGRESICGEGLPSLPDWDPGGMPPAWPV